MSDITILRPGYKKPASSAYPKDWRVSRLDELCTFHQGGKLGITKSSGYVTSGAPAYSAAGQDGYVNRVEFSNTDGVVLSAIGANCGRCFFASGDWTTLANVQAIIPSPSKLDAKYLYYRVNRESYWPRSGSAQPFIKPSDVRSCWVAHPPIRQQQLITHILDTLDTQIEKTEALIAKLEKVKEGLLHDLLTRGIGENGQLRPSPEQAPELYKESPLGLIPREWEAKKISEQSTKVTNGFVGVATPHYTESHSGVTYLYGNNIRKNKINLSKYKKVTQQFHKAQIKSQLKDGDMLTVQSGHIGTSAVFDFSKGEANCHALIITRFIPNMVNSRFASLYLNSTIGMRAQSRLFIGSTILHINTSDLAKLTIPTPSLTEQKRVVDHFIKIEKRLQLEANKHENLVKLKRGLMDDLLTGRIRITPLLEQLN